MRANPLPGDESGPGVSVRRGELWDEDSRKEHTICAVAEPVPRGFPKRGKCNRAWQRAKILVNASVAFLMPVRSDFSSESVLNVALSLASLTRATQDPIRTVAYLAHTISSACGTSEKH